MDDAKERILVTSLTKTCGACPTQWEGETEEAEEVYIRYRHGSLRVEVAGEAVLSVSPALLSDGVMSDDELRELTAGVLRIPRNINTGGFGT